MREIFAIPAFHDNYIWVIRKGMSAAVVDPGDAGPVKEAITRLGLTLTAILTTHHHADHVGGVDELLASWPVPVYGPAAESINVVDHPVTHGDRVRLPDVDVDFVVLDVGGHTLGHIAYSGQGALFCGDTLFAGGCGRIFEGTASQMWNSLTRLATLPGDTQVYCAHEYTAANLRFALAVEPANAALQQRAQAVDQLRAAGLPTVPSTIAVELETNPFLRVKSPEVIAAAVGYSGGELLGDAEVFSALRDWKNVF
ncbi:hydroxyacylglutathione hydrolase [Trinickia violacea]|uniref:Hydroxyacylglutathione hydrolase n=1 Tax=Trinickia violacea TaxID=2571746 RepID=A0A4P8IWD0_9BURK|nr:hydroxyacylglutathione hydrolase [Trinickia violacea]QCP51793.1 hydroxyacylglutathione hydrolase [Trinickia violacea]